MGYITIFTERISIHALCEEGDSCDRHSKYKSTIFLSTPSARRATWQRRHERGHQAVFLSTPSARRATSQVGA